MAVDKTKGQKTRTKTDRVSGKAAMPKDGAPGKPKSAGGNSDRSSPESGSSTDPNSRDRNPEAEETARLPSWRRLGVLPWLRFVLFGPGKKKKTEEEARLAKDGQTDSLLTRLLLLGAAMLAVLTAFGISLSGSKGDHWPSALHFIVWGVSGAVASYLVGIALGMLFGLPTTRGWAPRRATVVGTIQGLPVGQAPLGGVGAGKPGENTVANATGATGQSLDQAATAGGGAGTIQQAATTAPQTGLTLADHDIPYDESTSLEQIADWLTKIIVGLTLTLFTTWREYFESTARFLSSLMYREDVPTIRIPMSQVDLAALAKANPKIDTSLLHLSAIEVNPMAGGLVITGFGLLGFLMAYLWMRRYFIPEMVIARRNAVNIAVAQTQSELEIETAKASARAAKASEAAAKAEADRRVAEAERQKTEAEARLKAVTEAASAIQKPQGVTAQSPEATATAITSAVNLQLQPGERSTKKRDAIARIDATPVSDAVDPWKGRFGESSAGGFVLEGEVRAIEANPSQFSIELKVIAQDAVVRDRVKGKEGATFFLHPTFQPATQRVAFGPDGIAPLNLVGYGAFTVGVLLDDGTTLELNLASVPSAAQHPVFLAQ